MEQVVNVSRSEWEAFLADHSKLLQKFELLLTQLDLTRTKFEGLEERTAQQMSKSGEALDQIKTALDRLCEETEELLVEPE